MKWKLWMVICVVLVGLYYLAPSLVVGALAEQYLQPERMPLKSSPESYGLGYQNVAFESAEDQVKLRGWLIQSKEQNRRIVIFAHGYSENRESAQVALQMARALNAKGIASLLFDFRGAGQSGGNETSFGYYERNDLLGAIAYAKRLGYEQIGLVGFSMGAATALDIAPQFREVKAVVADSPYAKLDSYLRDNMEKLSPLPYVKIHPDVVLLEARLLTGIKPEDVQPIRSIQEMEHQAVFLIHAKRDPVIPYTESLKLKEASTAKETKLWICDTDQHVGTYNTDPHKYVAETVEFLTSYLPVNPHDKLVQVRLDKRKAGEPMTSFEVSQRRREAVLEKEGVAIRKTSGAVKMGQ
ncbi:MAG TPA: alpha/beta hydrolase [Bacilli bacterium]|nr:alpha/beta hydrolase [Bacilli bacterium]